MGNTILLADKSTTIQKIVQLTFADDNFNIHSVSDGQAALDMIPQIRPNLILADISLPLKSGYEVCSAIRTDPQFSSFSSIPVILLAGIYETMDDERTRQVEEKVKNVQANDFLSKPFDPQLLIKKVKQYLSVDSMQQPSAAPMFAQEPDSAINFFDAEPGITPPDDSEKTMMLPGGPFGNMFASEPAPFEEEGSGTPLKSTVDIDAVKPVDEPVFGEENFPGMELGAEDDDEMLSQSTIKIEKPSLDSGKFAGREEPEFEYRSGPVDVPAQSSEPESIPFILPSAEDPFGDVFQEPQAQWNAPIASEEDSPFGLPEPPPVTEIVAEDDEEEEAKFEVVEEPLEAIEPPQEVATETAPEAEITFEDTWPGVPLRSNAAHHVEDLFESEAPPVSLAEDAEELEEDLSESAEEPPVMQAMESAPVATAPAAPAQITDELIDRIAERVLSKLSERVVSEIVWQVVPDLAEKMIRRELEKLHAEE